MARTYDIIVFGATGFTGKYVVDTIVKTLKKNADEPFTWAVAGRSVSKLDKILEEMENRNGVSLKDIARIEADISSHASLTSMTRQGKVVLNCVGPYRFYGEQVVKACIAEGTHHLDVSGETQFLESMQLKYHKEAEEKGVYIVGACGFDSIPGDCGSMYLIDNFDGDVNSIEQYVDFDNDGKPTKVHYGTYHSAIHHFANIRELGPIGASLFPNPLPKVPKPKYKIPKRSIAHYSEVVKGWCNPLPMPDLPVMKRTQIYLYEVEKERPVQIQTYANQGYLVIAIGAIVGMAVFVLLTQFRLTRYLLESYPRLFTLGIISHEGPTPEEMDNFKFTITLVGEGWNDKLSDQTDVHKEPPNKKKVLKVRGTNPGYGATCICLLQAGLAVLKENSKLPSRGGVYTPGIAFRKTNLIQTLNKNGVTFTLED